MNLSKDEREELNLLLKDKSLDIPEFRRKISNNGSNYSWLRKNITKRNPNVDKRIMELLRI